MTEQALTNSTDVAVVVMGGSAGSIDALLTILEQLPPDFAAPVVVVVHTPKEPPSHLVAALSPRSRLPVREPEDKEPLAAGTVFVAPPAYHLLIERGPVFAFSVDAPENFSLPSIDVLFESAADVFGARVVGVVLSGANDDGAAGAAAIRRAGGIVLVQDPSEATSAEMPRAALAACPDAKVLPSLALPDGLVAIVRQQGRRE
jgi:two-component system chemotaxis response regulator CheB